MSAMALLCLVPAAQADDQAVLDRAMDGALGQLERALPQLDATLFGVNVAAYRDALALRPFSGGSWAGQNVVDLTIRGEASGSCSRYAAFVRLPPVDGRVPLVLCPQFFTPGADELRVLTVLHEMVHVVAGRDECQAMAVAARVEQLARGTFTPVDAYWRANGCATTRYRLP